MMRPAATRDQRNHQPARVVRSVISSLFADSPPKTPWDREPLLLPSPPCPSTPHAPHATTRVCFAVPRDISFPSPHSLADPALAPFPAPQPRAGARFPSSPRHRPTPRPLIPLENSITGCTPPPRQSNRAFASASDAKTLYSFPLYNREIGCRDEFARDCPLQRRVSSELGA